MEGAGERKGQQKGTWKIFKCAALQLKLLWVGVGGEFIIVGSKL